MEGNVLRWDEMGCWGIESVYIQLRHGPQSGGIALVFPSIFFLHCVLSFVGGFGNGHDRRGGNIAVNSFLFLSYCIKKSLEDLCHLCVCRENYIFSVSPTATTAIALRCFGSSI